MNKKLAILFFAQIILWFACAKDDPKPDSGLKGSYLGQTPPGNTPVRFIPDNNYKSTANWWWQSSPVFSPSGEEMYFTKRIASEGVEQIWFTRIENGVWSIPQKAYFANSGMDKCMMFLSNNDTMYFCNYSEGTFIYRVTRNSNGWSQPQGVEVPMPENYIGISYSIARNKNIYLAMMHKVSNNFMTNYATCDIYVSKYINGSYTQPENLGSVNSNEGECVDFIDPEERFIIISSRRAGGYGYHDLYISRRNPDGTWHTPVNLGPNINTSNEESSATISPDGMYMFFVTQRYGDIEYTPYWVSSSILEAH